MPIKLMNIEDKAKNSIGDLWEINSTRSMFINPKNFWKSVFSDKIQIQSSKDQRLPYNNSYDTIQSILNTLNQKLVDQDKDFYAKSQFSVDPIALIDTENTLPMLQTVAVSDGNHRFLLLMCCFYNIQKNESNIKVDGFKYRTSNGDIINYEFINRVNKSSEKEIKTFKGSSSETKTNQIAIKHILTSISKYNNISEINWEVVYNNIIAKDSENQLIINLKTFKDSNLSQNEQTDLDRVNNIINQEENIKIKEWIENIEYELSTVDFAQVIFEDHKEMMVIILKLMYFNFFDSCTQKVTEKDITEYITQNEDKTLEIWHKVVNFVQPGNENYKLFIKIFWLVKNIRNAEFIEIFKEFISFKSKYKFSSIEKRILQKVLMLKNATITEYDGAIIHFISYYLDSIMNNTFEMKVFLKHLDTFLEICIDEVLQVEFQQILKDGILENYDEINKLKLEYEDKVRRLISKKGGNKVMVSKFNLDEIKDFHNRFDKYINEGIYEKSMEQWEKIFKLIGRNEIMYNGNEAKHLNYRLFIYKYFEFNFNLDLFWYMQGRQYNTESRWELPQIHIHHIVAQEVDTFKRNMISNLLPVNSIYHKKGIDETQIKFIQDDLDVSGSTFKILGNKNEVELSIIEFSSNKEKREHNIIEGIDTTKLLENGWEEINGIEFENRIRKFYFHYHNEGKQILKMFEDLNGNTIFELESLKKHDINYDVYLKLNDDEIKFETKNHMVDETSGIFNNCKICVVKKKSNQVNEINNQKYIELNVSKFRYKGHEFPMEIGKSDFEFILKNLMDEDTRNKIVNDYGKNIYEVNNVNINSKYITFNDKLLFIDINKKIGTRESFFSRYIEPYLDIEIID